MIDDLKMNWRLLPDQWKAALRSAYQAVLAAVFVQLLVVLDALQAAVLGDASVDIVATFLDAGRLVLSAAIAAVTGVVAWRMNRGGRGATYPPPPGPAR